jgi:hypothetical protein
MRSAGMLAALAKIAIVVFLIWLLQPGSGFWEGFLGSDSWQMDYGEGGRP